MNISISKKEFSVLVLGNGLTGKSVVNWCDRNNIKSLIYCDKKKMILTFYPQ